MFAREVKPRLRGRAHLVRYADDFVIAFELEEDAPRVMDALPKRSANTACGSIQRQLDWFDSVVRAATPRLGRKRQSRRVSTCWASRTTGVGRGRATGWCIVRRQGTGTSQSKSSIEC
jgi:hypothetical protein